MGDEKSQIKSRERVRDHGEVFTAEREVKAMCDLVGETGSNPTKGTVLEPACGDGNFLVEILNRKLDRLDALGYRRGGRAAKWKWQVADLYAFRIATVLTLSDFEILVDKGVFNSATMNSCIWQFRSYEEESLDYLHIRRGEYGDDALIGGWDSSVKRSDIGRQ